ncbi:MAG: Ig-like domain-containing protein, partial [Candidatus Bathyarchaeota archaeon]
VFGHVMNDETHHSDYEDFVGTQTASYSYGLFESHLVFDGNLENISAYDASISLGRNTFNDGRGTYNANWMDTHYDWSNLAFWNRCGESLNLATNYVADVLHTLVVAAFGVIPTGTKSTSQISCSVSSTSINLNSSIDVSGTIIPARSGVAVTLSYTLPNATVRTRTVTSSSDGKYTDNYIPSTVGSWSVKASWEGDASYAGATSSSVSFTISKRSTTISFIDSPYLIPLVAGTFMAIIVSILLLGTRQKFIFRRKLQESALSART